MRKGYVRIGAKELKLSFLHHHHCLRTLQKRGVGSSGGYTLAQPRGLPLTQPDLVPQHRSTLSSQCGPVLQTDRPAACWKVSDIGLFPSRKGKNIVLIAIDTCSERGLPSPACIDSAETIICGFPEYLSHTALLLNKTRKSRPKKRGVILPCSPSHLQAAAVMDRRNGLVQMQLRCQRGDSTLQG